MLPVLVNLFHFSISITATPLPVLLIKILPFRLSLCLVSGCNTMPDTKYLQLKSSFVVYDYFLTCAFFYSFFFYIFSVLFVELIIISKILHQNIAVTPILLHLNPKFKIHFTHKKVFHFFPGGCSDFFEHFTFFSYDNSLV